MDVKSAFLNSNLEEEVYIKQLEGFQSSEKGDFVCRLRKALYGLKRAPRAWYSRLDKYLHQQGFKKGCADNNLYIKDEGNRMIIVVVYVDDIIFVGNKDSLSKDSADQMKSKFEISMLEELFYFLGLQISLLSKGIFISQTKYAKDMLKRFQMEDCKPISTPMVTKCKLSKIDESPDVDQTMYRSMIGSLLYLIASKPDIVQVVCMVARFQSAPKQSHVNVVRRIFKYLQGTLDYGLWYSKNDDFTLQAFTNADWVGCVDDKKSTSGGAFFLGGKLVSWHNKKQESISSSTVEAEYIAVVSCFTQVLWVKQTLKDILVEYSKPISIRCDNSSAINVSKSPIIHSRTKHIAIKYHFLREKVTTKEVKVE